MQTLVNIYKLAGQFEDAQCRAEFLIGDPDWIELVPPDQIDYYADLLDKNNMRCCGCKWNEFTGAFINESQKQIKQFLQLETADALQVLDYLMENNFHRARKVLETLFF